MPYTNCPRCGRPSPAGIKFCAGCGSNLSALSSLSGKGWKLFFGAFALFAGLLWAAAIYTRTQPAPQLAGASQPRALVTQSSTSNTLQAAQTEPSPQLTLTSAQHLSEAKRALADGYNPNKDLQKAQWGEVSAAKWHLKAIGSAAAEHREAQELLKEVARRERQIELARKQAEKDEVSDATAEADAAADDDHSSTLESSSAPAAPSSTYSSPTTTSSAPAGAATPSSTAGAGGGSSSDYYTNSRGAQVQRPTFSENGPPAGATAQCRDGSYSFSQSRRGTCSHHGGVSRWL
jgi:hypothetical protein